MERTIVSVTPATHGWRVECEDDVFEDVGDMQGALSTAWALARDVHRATGCPTAVKVRLGFGDGVMLSYNG